jgi:hypothetical protein
MLLLPSQYFFKKHLAKVKESGSTSHHQEHQHEQESQTGATFKEVACNMQLASEYYRAAEPNVIDYSQLQ